MTYYGPPVPFPPEYQWMLQPPPPPPNRKFTALAIISFIMGLCLFVIPGIGLIAAGIMSIAYDPTHIDGIPLFPVLTMEIILLLGSMGNIVGIVLGNIGRRKVNREPYIYSGKGLAIAGFVINIIGLVWNGLWTIIIGAMMILTITGNW